MKCKNCGTENPEGNLFCGKCGKPLAAQSVNQPEVMNHTPDQNAYLWGRKVSPILVIVVSALCICLCLAVLVTYPSRRAANLATETSQAIAIAMQPTVPSITRTVSPAPNLLPSPTQGLRYEDLIAGYDRQTTDLQKTQYMQQFYGTRVHWKMYVSNAYLEGEKAKLYVRTEQSWLSLLGGNVIELEDVPVNEAAQLSEGREVEFDAVIKSSANFGGLQLTLKWLAFTKR